MGALDFLKEFEGRVLDAKSYQLLRRNYELQEENNKNLKDKIIRLESEISELQQLSKRLTVENENLTIAVNEFKEKEKYKVHKGVLFMINQNGTVEPLPLCPNCRVAMSDSGAGMYKCPKCNYVANPHRQAHVLVRELTDILSKEV